MYDYTSKYIIPLTQLEKVDFVTGSIVFRVEQRAIRRHVSEDHGNSYKKTENSESAFIGFDRYGEDKLGERMLKAFNHLQTLCPRVKESEPF